MRNELLIHSYERARNDQRYADWIAKGGPELRREQIAREQEAFWRAVAGDSDSLARLVQAAKAADRLREQLQAATNGDALDLIADEISLVESEADRKALTELYLKRRAELAG